MGDEILIEMHGEQHYTGRFSQCMPSARTLEEEQENDRFKKQQALENGIKEENYIVIDCRKSELEWIKNNILKSRLNELLDLSKIDWIKCAEIANKSLVKEVCEIWNNTDNINILDIAERFGISKYTVVDYLKKGNVLWDWCNYNPKEKTNKTSGKTVKIFKDGIELGEYPSIAELSRCSEGKFGIKLDSRRISDVCNNKLKQHKGFTFKYIDESITYNK
jgi:transposase